MQLQETTEAILFLVQLRQQAVAAVAHHQTEYRRILVQPGEVEAAAVRYRLAQLRAARETLPQHRHHKETLVVGIAQIAQITLRVVGVALAQLVEITPATHPAAAAQDRHPALAEVASIIAEVEAAAVAEAVKVA